MTELTGLTSLEVQSRIDAEQTNESKSGQSRSLTSIIRSNVVTSFNIVIGSLWALMFLAQAPLQDSLFGFVIVINSAIGIIQEYRAKRTLDRLSLVGEARPMVMRDGAKAEVRPSELVLDDIVVLRLGDQIVVDGTVREAVGLEVDESLLTGEADPVHKTPGDEVRSGSFVVAGSGLMQATRVGADSYATKLTSEARKFTRTKSELIDSIMRFVRTVTWVLIPLGTLLFISQMKSSPDWQTALSGTVAGIVTMVPEGLVLLTSVAMAVAVVRLGRKQTLVQDMPAVEVLARVDVVCVDKTGTLTEPGMAVTRLIPLDHTMSEDDVEEALGAMGASEANPNPTLLAVAATYRNPGWSMSRSVPFSSARKWSAASFDKQGDWIFGAPEVLLPAGHKARGTADEFAAQGSRVLLLGRIDRPADPQVALPEVSAVALVVINQRLRSDAASTVRYFLDQGVAVKVISGDNPVTVGAIAAEAGIPMAEHPYDARNLPEDVDALADVLQEQGVFGRVTPAQKRAMVGALQSRGHTVAMTGDGVNDVLALKDADLGIAMGSGAGATRGVAQLVLLDDQFSVMPSVVAEGRRVLGNIERVSDLFLTKSFYSAFLSLFTVMVTLLTKFNIEFLFLPRHLTIITWLTIGTPAFFLALMPNTARFKPGFFTRVLWFVVPAGLICAVLSFASYLLVLVEGRTVDEARVSASITLFIIAWTLLLVVAQPWNQLRLFIVGVMGLGFLGALWLPWVSEVFALQLGIDSDGLTAVALGGVGAALFVLVRRLLMRRNPDLH